MPGFTNNTFIDYKLNETDPKHRKNNPSIDHPSSSVILNPYPVKIDNGITFPEIPKEDNHASEFKPGD